MKNRKGKKREPAPLPAASQEPRRVSLGYAVSVIAFALIAAYIIAFPPVKQIAMLFTFLNIPVPEIFGNITEGNAAEIAPSEPLPLPPQRPGKLEGVAREVAGGRANVTGVSKGGQPLGYLVFTGDGANESADGRGTEVVIGDGLIIVIDDPALGCSDDGEIVELEMNFIVNGTLYTETVNVILPPCPDGDGEELCGGAGEPCGICCSGLACSDATGRCVYLSGCGVAGQVCGSEPCCEGFVCDQDKHTCAVQGCSNEGGSCEGASDCCAFYPPMVCYDLTCQRCAPKGALCTEDADCCAQVPSMACQQGACAIVQCSFQGGSCNDNTDCCDSAHICASGRCALPD